jgi:NAD(P)-dependent dehydrogenase (short-subunit alcohol dehydrogenase family)
MKALEGKTALVTGASRGIGRAIAIRLAAAGARVAVHYGADRAAAESVVEAITTAGGSAIAVGADLRNIAAIDAMFGELDANGFDRLDILVNNAGVGLGKTLAEVTEEDFDLVFATNMKGPFFVTQRAVSRIPDGGTVIMTSSMTAFVGYPNVIAYAATKAAINSFTKSLALELAPRKIRVNAVAPGATATDFFGAAKLDEALLAQIGTTAPLNRIGRPDDIAPVVEFLASPASGWMTGQIVQASGGMHV